MKLYYSPDDRGYYWQRSKDWKTSQLFATEEDARQARQADALRWS